MLKMNTMETIINVWRLKLLDVVQSLLDYTGEEKQYVLYKLRNTV